MIFENLPEYLKKNIENIKKEAKLSEEDLKNIIEKIFYHFQPGEAIGIVTAQSISEPATQLTMRTYHMAGSLGVKITQGLPRLIEIFDAKKEIDNPVTYIFLKPEYNNEEDAKKVAEKIVERKVINMVEKFFINIVEKRIELIFTSKRAAEKTLKALEQKKKGIKINLRENTIFVYPEKEDVSLIELQSIKEKVLNITVEGIEGIKNAFVRREGNEWIIEASGTNLEKIMQVEEIDNTRTYSNDLYEVQKVLGIEAARNLIIREALKVMQSQGLDVNPYYLTLLADLMCFDGRVRPIGRYGIAGSKSSVLVRANFEETIKHLIVAAIRNEKDTFKGIYENVFIGRPAPVGTGYFELIVKKESGEDKRDN